MMKRRNKKSERGVALLVALFALILIAAVGLGMIFASNSEFSVNSSFRQNHLVYFAARSGLEEARDRMRYLSTDNPVGVGISDLLVNANQVSLLKSLGQANSVIYIINGNGIDPTSTAAGNKYFDDELCHEINNTALIPNSPGSFNIKCPLSSSSLPTGGFATKIQAEAIPNNGGSISYAWTRINLKMQESTSPWCVLGIGNCTPLTNPGNPAVDQICYDGSREFVLSDALPLRDVPEGIRGISPPAQLAMGMYFGGTSGHSQSGHSGNTTSSSTTGSTTGSTSSSGTSGSGTSTSGSSTTSSSSSSSSSTGSSTTGSSTTGSSTTGSSSTGSTSTGSSTTGTSSTGTSTTGTSTTGTSTTGTSSTGTSSTGSTSTGSSTTGTSSTGTSTTGTSTTGTSTTGTSSTGSSTSGSSSSGTSGTGSSGTSSSSTGTSSTGGTTGGSSGTGAACSGIFSPPPPPPSFNAPSCGSVNGQPVYTLTTLALAPSGARRMLQYEIARLSMPPVPAALTMAGPSPTFNSPNSFNFGINGNDANSCGGNHQVNNLPAIGTTTDTGNPTTGETPTQVATDSENTVYNALTGPGVKTNNFYGAGCPGVASNPQGPGGDVQNVINVDPNYNSVAGLNNLVQAIIGTADVVTSSPSSVTNWGTATEPAVIAITGSNSDVSAGSGGYGVLLVTGNMVASGGFTWNGEILVVGSGSVTFEGGGNGSLTGAIVVANIGNADYASDPTNSGNLLTQMGSPSFTFKGGGTNFLQYDSCITTFASSHASYKVLARREIVY